MYHGPAENDCIYKKMYQTFILNFIFLLESELWGKYHGINRHNMNRHSFQSVITVNIQLVYQLKVTER